MKFINYAIDLGTTNSLIARHQDGQVILFKNPKGFRETLPSVVAYRKNGILIGEKARELKDRDPQNVFSSFKRKMGTDESYYVPQIQETISPIQLSTLVLNELQTFVRDEQPASAVITIPASFDTIQSNATKEAGKQAGLREVVLLQEPIAACLAVFNQHHQNGETGRWLIYDLGGGTFDVAIVEATEEELRVIDHQGNNFLGGLDFDIQILSQLMLPQIATQGNFEKLIEGLRHNPDAADTLPVFNYLLFYAEQIKIELTSYPECDIDFELKDDDGEAQEISIRIHREAFNSVIEPSVQYTISLINELLSVNNLQPGDFNEIVLVGGSTYIPFIREKLEFTLGISVNQRVDPTNAIAIGAAYYAGNKPSRLTEEITPELTPKTAITLTPVYERQSRETSEMVLIKTEGELSGQLFRVYRTDLGYDSGKLALRATVPVTLPLKPKAVNEFKVELYDAEGSLINAQAGFIQISQGLFIIDGQPLPHDICIEVDNPETGETLLEPIFEKNTILPLTKTIYKVISRNMLDQSEDSLIINILEGDRHANPSTNQVIGCITISPAEIGHNLYKDTDIGITLSVSESRDLTVSASISVIDFEVRNVFSPTQKTVHLPKLREEFNFLMHSIQRDLSSSLNNEEFETAAVLQNLKQDCEQAIQLIGTTGEIASDVKYSQEELKRQISVRYDKLMKHRKMAVAMEEYQYAKDQIETLMQQPDFPERIKQHYRDILQKEQSAIAGNNVGFLRSLEQRLTDLIWEYERTNVNALRAVYLNYKLLPPDAYKDRNEASRLFDAGDDLLGRSTTTAQEMLRIIGGLWHILEDRYKRNRGGDFDLKGTGLR